MISNADNNASEEVKVEPMHVDIRNLTFGYPGMTNTHQLSMILINITTKYR